MASNQEKEEETMEVLPLPDKPFSRKLIYKIAKTINAADTNFFNEDYSYQAEEVLKMLFHQGYVIMPEKPTPEIIEAGLGALKTGRHYPEDVVRHFYDEVLRAGRQY